MKTAIAEFTPPPSGPAELAARLSGLNLVRLNHLLAEAVKTDVRVTADVVSSGKKRLIEEFCQGLVRFKYPQPGLSLDAVATHVAAKAKLRELAWLIRMKRQGRFGLSIPLFPAQTPDKVMELFTVVAKVRKTVLPEGAADYIRTHLGDRPLTGSDVEAILVRAKERAVLAQRDNDLQITDLQEAVDSFIDPLDPALLAMQELAAVLACSDKRYLPERYRDADRTALREEFQRRKLSIRMG